MVCCWAAPLCLLIQLLHFIILFHYWKGILCCLATADRRGEDRLWVCMTEILFNGYVLSRCTVVCAKIKTKIVPFRLIFYYFLPLFWKVRTVSPNQCPEDHDWPKKDPLDLHPCWLDLVLFKFAGPFYLAGQLAPLGHGNVDGIIVVVTINFSIRMVTLATWRSITIAVPLCG